MKAYRSLVWSLLLLFCLTPLWAVEYVNEPLGFRATLPEGLDDLTQMMRIKSLVSRAKMDASTGTLVKLVSLQDLGGVIGREELSKQPGLPAGVSFEKTAWKSFQLEASRIVEQSGGISMVTFNVQVPLKPHAIQVMVAGPATEEAALRQEMQTVVASIEGPSNWLTTEERVVRGLSGFGRLILFGCLLGLIIVSVVRKLIRWRKAPQ